MPVWHEATKALRASGKLTVIGITQEQHPDRCRLFAQWHGIEWPILWDPFNMTGSSAVPRFFLIDEHGVVQSLRANKNALEGFLAKSYPAVKAKSAPKGTGKELVQVLTSEEGSPERKYHEALSSLLWSDEKQRPGATAILTAYALAHPKDAAAQWRLGVAHRMRYDSPRREPGDFQRALDQWREGLNLDPRQYIYRRRIQQYGPRLDKPYPFYDWIERAQDAIRARGETPVELAAPLSGAERASRGPHSPAVEGAREPDAKGEIDSGAGCVRVESAVAGHTDAKRRSRARVHLLIRPTRTFRWEPEAGPVSVWIHAPPGAVLPRQLLARRPADTAGGVAFDFEIELPGSGASKGLRAYALFYGCRDDTGECTYLRHDFEITIPERR